ncbi:MAG: HIT domain-containing protein [Caulobacteraceae bacterium]|nr:HIT domain-containing protein [Caulobacter sp.]
MTSASPAPSDARLLAGSSAVGTLPLSDVRLQDDVRWPWLVLIPRRAGLVELEALSAPERAALMEEAVRAGEAVRRIGAATGFAVAKLNVGALGNVVSQLHLHVVGRRPGDAAWPGPVWGAGVAEPYAPAALARALAAARDALGVAAPGPAR